MQSASLMSNYDISRGDFYRRQDQRVARGPGDAPPKMARSTRLMRNYDTPKVIARVPEMKSRPRIIITGMVGLFPVGGVAWGLPAIRHRLRPARLRDLLPRRHLELAVHPIEKTFTFDGRYSAQFLAEFFQRYAPKLRERWHYFHLHETSYGMSRAAFEGIAHRPTCFSMSAGHRCFPRSSHPAA